MRKKPLANLSLDLDNKWAYLKAHGDSNWETFPTYFPAIVPRILEFLDDKDLDCTFFVIGQDAEIPENHDSLRMIADAGHEIANHSFHHEPWLHLYPPARLIEEFERSEQVIEEVTGQKTIGFRGPGFSLSDQVLRTLIRRGYKYDGTTFPTFLGPVARAFYFFTSHTLSKEDKEDRKELFGRFSDGFRSNRPYRWNWRGQEMVEVPVTTMPIFKLPIHGSYILYLGQFSPSLARLYFWLVLKMCRVMSIEPSFLLHPLDFMTSVDEPDMGFFPGMNQSLERKQALLADCFGMLTSQFEVLNMKDYVERLAQRQLPVSTVSVVPEGASDGGFARSTV
jgi:hypothetical protein